MPRNKSVARLSMVNGKPVGRRYARVNDAAAYLDVHPITIRQMIADGKIRAYRSGSRLIRVDLNEIDALMAGETNGVA
ncbi:excisionase family DNA-binding protein [Mycobacterium sp. E3198]|uniref:excisionase family DNA-binding protein n=1 Tax=Mycobacterium sp. E3198 TaxID=1834143 RepID=UPI000AE50464|nr:excisionase family DNA-binding protein [Mycobacterium sp. E3198]